MTEKPNLCKNGYCTADKKSDCRYCLKVNGTCLFLGLGFLCESKKANEKEKKK